MIDLDEVYTVTITINGHTQTVATGQLNGDRDTPATLCNQVAQTGLIDDEEAYKAFYAAFDACEQIPGNHASQTYEGSGFSLTVERRLSE